LIVFFILLATFEARTITAIGDGGSSGTRISLYDDDCIDEMGNKIPIPVDFED